MSDPRITELEQALAREKDDRADAEDRARRAIDRANDSDAAYRKLQLAVVAAQDELASARAELTSLAEKSSAMEAELETLREKVALLTPVDATGASTAPAQIDDMLERVRGMRDVLNSARADLVKLREEDTALAERRWQVIDETCAVLLRVIGEGRKGPGGRLKVPPPLPAGMAPTSGPPMPRLSVAPDTDISEIAELLESLRPPAPPKVE